MGHIRAHIRIVTQSDILRLMDILSSSEDSFSIEDFSGSHRVNARSILGVLYITSECSEKVFLVNDTHDGVFPNEINEMRVLA